MRHWAEVSTEVDARARPAVPEAVPEGSIAEDWILEINGEKELVKYDELCERVEFSNEFTTFETTIPFKELAEAYNYIPNKEYKWRGDDEGEAKVKFDPARGVATEIHFPDGVSLEALSEIGIE